MSDKLMDWEKIKMQISINYTRTLSFFLTIPMEHIVPNNLYSFLRYNDFLPEKVSLPIKKNCSEME